MKTKSATPWNCGFRNAYMGMKAPDPKDGERTGRGYRIGAGVWGLCRCTKEAS